MVLWDTGNSWDTNSPQLPKSSDDKSGGVAVDLVDTRALSYLWLVDTCEETNTIRRSQLGNTTLLLIITKKINLLVQFWHLHTWPLLHPGHQNKQFSHPPDTAHTHICTNLPWMQEFLFMSLTSLITLRAKLAPHFLLLWRGPTFLCCFSLPLQSTFRGTLTYWLGSARIFAWRHEI